MTGRPHLQLQAPLSACAAAAVDGPQLCEACLVRQNWWDGVEEKPAAVAIGVGALVVLWATSGLVDAIDKLPVIGGLLEVVGLVVTGWCAPAVPLARKLASLHLLRRLLRTPCAQGSCTATSCSSLTGAGRRRSHNRPAGSWWPAPQRCCRLTPHSPPTCDRRKELSQTINDFASKVTGAQPGSLTAAHVWSCTHPQAVLQARWRSSSSRAGHAIACS